jgi:hypothetical protein
MTDGFGETTKFFHYLGLLKRKLNVVKHNLTGPAHGDGYILSCEGYRLSDTPPDTGLS